MPIETTVHGFIVAYDEESAEGINFLRDELKFEEAKIFFNQAKKKSAEFKDDKNRPYLLSYAKNKYSLTRA